MKNIMIRVKELKEEFINNLNNKKDFNKTLETIENEGLTHFVMIEMSSDISKLRGII